MGISKKRKINQYKRIFAAVIAVLGVCVPTICILTTENISDMTQAAKITIIIGGCVVFGIAFIIAVILDRAAGHYECRECHHHFQPSIAAYLLGMRSPTKRYLKCPKCGKRNYCKVIFSEEHCE